MNYNLKPHIILSPAMSVFTKTLLHMLDIVMCDWSCDEPLIVLLSYVNTATNTFHMVKMGYEHCDEFLQDVWIHEVFIEDILTGYRKTLHVVTADMEDDSMHNLSKYLMKEFVSCFEKEETLNFRKAEILGTIDGKYDEFKVDFQTNSDPFGLCQAATPALIPIKDSWVWNEHLSTEPIKKNIDDLNRKKNLKRHNG